MLTREFLKQFDMINDTINKRVTLLSSSASHL